VLLLGVRRWARGELHDLPLALPLPFCSVPVTAAFYSISVTGVRSHRTWWTVTNPLAEFAWRLTPLPVLRFQAGLVRTLRFALLGRSWQTFILQRPSLPALRLSCPSLFYYSLLSTTHDGIYSLLPYVLREKVMSILVPSARTLFHTITSLKEERKKKKKKTCYHCCCMLFYYSGRAYVFLMPFRCAGGLLGVCLMASAAFLWQHISSLAWRAGDTFSTCCNGIRTVACYIHARCRCSGGAELVTRRFNVSKAVRKRLVACYLVKTLTFLTCCVERNGILFSRSNCRCSGRQA
jgi:hypothetical protein